MICWDCAEMVFAKTYNIYLDLCFHIASGGPDFKLGGKTIDVKTTHHANGRLIVPMAKKNKPSDRYVLITGDLPKFTIRGFATSDEVFSSQGDVGHGPCFVINQEKLHAFKFSRISDQKKTKVLELRATGLSYDKIAKETKVSRSSVIKIIRQNERANIKEGMIRQATENPLPEGIEAGSSNIA